MSATTQPFAGVNTAKGSLTAERARAARAGKNRDKRKGHPTTAEVDYSRAEVEFMFAIEAFKNRSGRKFPTWQEVLRVIVALGYSKECPGDTFDRP